MLKTLVRLHSITKTVCQCQAVKVTVPNQEIERSCICVLGVSLLSLSTILILDFGNVLTVWYFFVFISLSVKVS